MFGEYSKEDGEKLLKLARESINEEFTKQKPEKLEGKEFKQARGVFVTLTKAGELRGCIGFPLPNYPIEEAVYLASKSAAFSDPRFKPLVEDEFAKIKIEISILSNLADVKDIKEIMVGRDGLICNYLGYSGLLLPQVATEWKMDRIKFLEALANKAGLPRESWQNKNFKIQKFQVQIFKE